MIRVRFKRLFVFVLVLGKAASANSLSAEEETLKSIRADDAIAKALQKEADYSAFVCGETIDARIDWVSFRHWSGREEILAACDSALSGLETACRLGRAATVTSFTCRGDGAGPAYNDGALVFGAAPDDDGYDATISLFDGL